MGKIVWKPTADYIENANITRFMKKNNIKDYNQLMEKSTEDIEWFWDAALKDLNIEWYKPYEKVYDDSKGIQWTKWFIGGKINIVHNCLDKHAKSERKNNIAIIWENENPQVLVFYTTTIVPEWHLVPGLGPSRKNGEIFCVTPGERFWLKRYFDNDGAWVDVEEI